MSETWDKYANEHSWTVIDTLRRIADELGKSPAQVALNWLLNRPSVTASILGARSRAQLADNMGAAGWGAWHRGGRCPGRGERETPALSLRPSGAVVTVLRAPAAGGVPC